MAQFLMEHWYVVLGIALLLGGGDYSFDMEQEDDDDWHANPMNKVGMNYMGD